MKIDVFWLILVLKITKNTTKNASKKNLYCAENCKTKMDFMRIEMHKILRSFCFFEIVKTRSDIKLKMKRILITDFIPFKKSQFFT